jgi:periplasmic copper chaperone A
MRIANTNLLHSLAIGILVLTVLISAAMAADLTVSDGWIRAMPASVPSGGYFTLHNGGAKAVALTGATSPACGMLMLHQSENMGGMTNMQDVARVDVPAGGTIKFSPGGYHLMCMGATKAIQPGQTVAVTLEFSNGAKLVSRFAVRNAAGK